MRSAKLILSISLLAFTLSWSLWYVFAGYGNPMDPFYWLYKYQSLESGWMSVGTILTGGALVRLFGAQLLPLRLAGWLTIVAAILVPYGALLNREQRLNNLHWLALAFGLMGYGAFQEFSPGTLTVLLLSAIWVSATKSPITRNEVNRALAAENHQSPILTAILAGLAVSIRFPNILVLLVLLPLWRKKSLWLVPITAASAGLVYLLGYLFVTPAYMDPSMGSHGIMAMVSKLWENGAKVLGYALLWLGVWAVYQVGGKFEIKNQRFAIINPYMPLIAGIVMGAFLIYYITFVPAIHQWYNVDVTYLISVGCLFWALMTKRRELAIGVAILMVATLGTDTAWLKLFPAAVCLFAIAASRMEQEVMRRYWFPVALGLTVAVMMRFSVNCIGDYNLRYCTVRSSVAPYEHIFIREVDEAQLKQYKADYDSLYTPYTIHHTPIIAFGQDMHRMRSVTGCQAARYNEFWSNIFDSVYTAKYREIIEAERPIVFCSYSPRFKTKPTYKDRHSALEEMLRSEGYREIDRSKYRYMIYIPDDEKIQ